MRNWLCRRDLTGSLSGLRGPEDIAESVEDSEAAGCTCVSAAACLECLKYVDLEISRAIPLQNLTHEQVYVLERELSVPLGSLGIEKVSLRIAYTADTYATV